MNEDTPRWKHKCPGCKRTIFWEYVYCRPCQLSDSRKKNFRITNTLTSYRKGRMHGLLPTIKMTRDHIFAMVKEFILCVECGCRTRGTDLHHRCYFLTDASIRPQVQVRCRLCKIKKSKHLFPMFTRRGKILRARVCSDCLHGTEIVVPHKRRYERRKAHA